MNNTNWPLLNFNEIHATLETLHQWIQIVGKIRLRTMPWQNHSWHAALYITPHGFSTHGIPYQGKIFQIDFDFINHQLIIKSSDADTRKMRLESKPVADFYYELFHKLSGLGIHVRIHGSPNEMEPAIPFKKNIVNKVYDPSSATVIWKAMVQANNVFYQFRSDYIGKSSPVHLFWGAFDLAVTRFSGRPAPLHPGGMPNIPLEVMQEAYSREVSSAGFWLGSKDFPTPVFYAYAYPSNELFGKQKIIPSEGFYSSELGEFFLKYEDVRNSNNPEKFLLDFLTSTYEAATNTSKWNIKGLLREA